LRVDIQLLTREIDQANDGQAGIALNKIVFTLLASTNNN